VVQARLGPGAAPGDPPAVRLIIWPEMAFPAPDAHGTSVDATNPRCDPAVLAHRLAYHFHWAGGAPSEGPYQEDFLVDAHTGALIKSWSTLLTAKRRRPRGGKEAPGLPAQGTGRSRFSGEVPLATTQIKDGYELTDATRGGLSTRNMGGGTSGPGEAYQSSINQWGDGRNYDPTFGAASANGQTAAVDAHYGLQMAWDFYRNVLGRDGVDGQGRAVTNRVHFGENFENAFWKDSCFCITFGDGARTGIYTSLEVVGHEITHGLCSSTADLIYEGESGGLNEANSDIFGVLIRAYALKAGGQGTTVPDPEGPWALGGAGGGQPYRFLDQPSRDGFSRDAWSPGLQFLDVHASSGPMNRAFYFLAMGASPAPDSPAHSPFLPDGMKGIGADKALRIWWRTLSTRLTPTSGYRQARKRSLRCAQELYGQDSPEHRAVALAFKAINVGKRPQ
jgi:Zn-dependent metalloprotease